jgi:uncharacterized surface protein with fasciclin (FAS1) repeats
MKNLVETSIDVGNLKILIKVVQEADLVDTLSGDGPFTIFAPTDEAFSKLPSETLKNLLNDKEKLTELLTYHVISNKVMLNDVLNINNAKTVNGKEIKIDISDGIKIDKACLIKPDIECSNGVIHLIDEVLIPK